MVEKEPAKHSHNQWGLWEDVTDVSTPHRVRLCVFGEEVEGSFQLREEAVEFQLQQLRALRAWPREAVQATPAERSPIWDHPEELEPLKQYTFRDVTRQSRGKALDVSQLEAYREDGFLLNLPVLTGNCLEEARQDFDNLVLERTERASDRDSQFRAAHTLARPLHQDLVQRLATHERELIFPALVHWNHTQGHPWAAVLLLECTLVLQAAWRSHSTTLAPGCRLLATFGVTRCDSLGGLR
eukprot:symbB.v1.2.006794.t1/scaffold396.1/size242164/21